MWNKKQLDRIEDRILKLEADVRTFFLEVSLDLEKSSKASERLADFLTYNLVSTKVEKRPKRKYVKSGKYSKKNKQ